MKNFTLILTIGFLWVSVGFVLGQNQTNIWYFGENQGLDFNSGMPTQLTDGKLNTNEGSATVCDENGKLLLYTDGITVWNSRHEPMPNGNNLNGNKSTTQAALIVPKPGSTTIYYIFTVDADAGKNGLCYSVADMALEEGFGDITTKNVQLFTPSTEKITAAMHANGTDVWIITHEWEGNGFYAHLLTENGISKSVKSNAGSAHSGFIVNTRGCMKASADGSKLAAAILYDYKVELFDFDKETGEVKNPVTIPMPPNVPTYGIEFSANGNWLYVSSADLQSKVWQYNITLPSATEIINSATEVLSLRGSVGTMQLAPDGKIYFAVYFSNRLGVIEKPDLEGSACSAKDSAIVFSNQVRWGLPNLVPAFFMLVKADFTWQPVCFGSPMQFNVTEETRADSVMWNFGDMSAGKMVELNYGRNPLYTFSQAGNFIVELVVYKNGNTDTISKQVEVWQMPAAYLGADTFICKMIYKELDKAIDACEAQGGGNNSV